MSIKPEELERRARVKAKQREYRRTSSQTARRYPPTRPKPQFCELCQQRPAEALDHCHTRKVFRGWLCMRCNLGLGMLGDSADTLQRAANYLKLSESDALCQSVTFSVTEHKSKSANQRAKKPKKLNCALAYKLLVSGRSRLNPN